MDEQLDTIRNDLGCNAVIVDAGGDFEDELIECAKLAIEKDFDRVYVQPRYINYTIDDTIERVGKLARRVREFRQTSEAIVYHLGHEFTLETQGIVPGSNWWERLAYCNTNEWASKVREKLPKMFSDLIAVCEANYGYEISYAAIAWAEVDTVPWSHRSFESIGVDAYVQPEVGWTEDWIRNLLTSLKTYRKPVISTEAGCMSFSGADTRAGSNLLNTWAERAYDEDVQAQYIHRYCELLNRTRIDGYFYTQFNDSPYFDKGYGLYNGKKRKKGFYMYKSYQRSP